MEKVFKKIYTLIKSWRDNHLFTLVSLKSHITRGFKKTHYSQSGEDIILEKLFQNTKNGLYVDVGAYHPFHYSNTYLLHKKGWHGINIDPNPKSITLFKKYRKADTAIRMGILTKKIEAPYYVFNHQSCNTFSEKQRQIMEQTSYARLIKVDHVLCAPLGVVLKAHLSPQPIDLLTIDAEGHDYDVLNSHDWRAYPPKVIVVEDGSFNVEEPQKSTIYKFLHDKDYTLYAYTGLSCIFTNNKTQ